MDKLQVALDYAIQSSPLDKLNKNIDSAVKSTNKLESASKRASNSFSSTIGSMGNKISGITKGILGIGAAVGGLALGKGISQAMDLEGYRLTLETVMKDTKKAADLMSWGNQFANVTPFENAEIVQGIVKLQSYGMEAKKVLPKVGDMAAVMGKSMDQAVEAIADAQTGQLERMKEFGITKDMIIKQAQEMRMGLIVNNKGQITDQQKFNQAMFALMDKKFKGGMEKQASTAKGLWSTITGSTKSALAEIVGITSEGTIKQGSLFDSVKNSMTGIISKLNEWQQDGTLKAIGDNVTNIVGGMVTVFSNLFTFLSKNKEIIIPLASAIGGMVTTILLVNGAIKTWTILQTALNIVMSANPIGIAVVALGGLVAGLVAAYNSSETFRGIIKGLWDMITGFLTPLGKVASLVGSIFGGGGNKNLNVNTTTTTKSTGTTNSMNSMMPSHRTGESFVPNDTMAQLHYGERVLTKSQNEQYTKGNMSAPSINISINAVQELGNEIKLAIQPVVENAIKNYQQKQLLKLGIGGA